MTKSPHFSLTTAKVDRDLGICQCGSHRCYLTGAPRRLIIGLGALVTLQLAVASLTLAQDVERISEREIARRQAALPRGEEALARGRLALKDQNFTVAHEEFRTAVSFLPDASVSGKSRDQAVEGFCESGV